MTVALTVGGVLAALAVWCWIPSARSLRVRAVAGRDQTAAVPPLARVASLLSRVRPRADDRRVVEAFRALAAELRSGAVPDQALVRAAGEPPVWPHAINAATAGLPIAEGLERDAVGNPRRSAYLRHLAVCWDVGVGYGAGLSLAIDRLAASVQSQGEVCDRLRSELAAPRASTRVLILLPWVGLAMGFLLGANPVAWFMSSSVGRAALAAAIGLTLVGALWTRRIVRRVERAL